MSRFVLYPGLESTLAFPDIKTITGWDDIKNHHDIAERVNLVSFFSKNRVESSLGSQLKPKTLKNINLPSSWIPSIGSDGLTNSKILDQDLDVDLFKYIMSYSYQQFSTFVEDKYTLFATLNYYLTHGDHRLFRKSTQKSIEKITINSIDNNINSDTIISQLHLNNDDKNKKSSNLKNELKNIYKNKNNEDIDEEEEEEDYDFEDMYEEDNYMDNDEDEDEDEEYIGRIGQACGHVFKNGESVYRCRDCALDDTCVLCSKCFHSSNHENHDTSVTISVGSGGCCDCGDKEAWVIDLFCKHHNPNPNLKDHINENQQDISNIQPLPKEFVNHIRKVINTILEFILDTFSESIIHPFQNEGSLILQKGYYETYDEEEYFKKNYPVLKDKISTTNTDEFEYKDYNNYLKLLDQLKYIANKKSSDDIDIINEDRDKDLRISNPLKYNRDNYSVVLWNDEFHSFMDVIQIVMKAINVSRQVAEDIATDVDTHGRNIMGYALNYDDAKKIGEIVSSIGLLVTVRTTRETNREVLAGLLLEWLHGIDALFGRSPVIIDDIKYENIGNIIKIELNKALLSPRLFAKRSFTGFTQDSYTGLTKKDTDLFKEDKSGDLLNRVDYLLIYDSWLWKDVRSSIKKLLISTLIISGDPYRKELGNSFAHNLLEICEGHVFRDRNQDYSVMSFAVQLFTVPSIASYIITNMDTFENILYFFKAYQLADIIPGRNNLNKFKSILYTVKANDEYRQPALKSTAVSISNNKLLELFSCIHYLMTNSKSPLKTSQFQIFANICSLWQRMDPQKRAKNEHILFESEGWANFFNFSAQAIRIISKIPDCVVPFDATLAAFRNTLFWSVEEGFYERNIKKGIENSDHIPASISELEKDTIQINCLKGCNWLNSNTRKDTSINSTYNFVELETYLVDTHPISFHHPLHWLLASSIIKLSDNFPLRDDFKSYFSLWQKYLNSNHKLILDGLSNYSFDSLIMRMFEYPLRVVVLLSQIRSGLWVRNGFSIKAQAAHYSILTLKDCYDYDLFLVQIAAILIENKNSYLTWIIDRFQLLDWFDGNWSQTNSSMNFDDSVITCLVEDLLNLLVITINERGNLSGMKEEELLIREVIHNLVGKPLPFSELSKKIQGLIGEESPLFEKVLDKVSNFKPPAGLSDTGVYVLKDEYIKYVDPWFYHITRNRRESIMAYLKQNNLPLSQCFSLPDLLSPFKSLPDFIYCERFSKLLFYSLWNSYMTRNFGHIVSSIIKLLELVLDVAFKSSSTDKDNNNTMKWKFLEISSSLVFETSIESLSSRRVVVLPDDQNLNDQHGFFGLLSVLFGLSQSSFHKIESSSSKQNSVNNILLDSLTTGKWTLIRFIIAIIETKPGMNADSIKYYGLYSRNDENIDSDLEEEIKQYRERFINILQTIYENSNNELESLLGNGDSNDSVIPLQDGTVYTIDECQSYLEDIKLYLSSVKESEQNNEEGQALIDTDTNLDGLTDAQYKERKEQAKKRREAILAEFADVQQQFINNHKEDLGIEDDDDDESVKSDIESILDEESEDEIINTELPSRNVDTSLSNPFESEIPTGFSLEQDWEYPTGMCIMCKEETNMSTEIYCILGHVQPSIISKNLDLDKESINKNRYKLSNESSQNSFKFSPSNCLTVAESLNNVLSKSSSTFDINVPVVEPSNSDDKKKATTLKNIDTPPKEQIDKSKMGLYTSTCGHLMHISCFQQYFESLSDSRSNEQRLFERLDNKEYSCPLCKSLGNCLIPVLWNSRKERISLAGGSKFNEDTERLGLPWDYNSANVGIGSWWTYRLSNTLVTLRERQRKFRKLRSSRMRSRRGSISSSLHNKNIHRNPSLTSVGLRSSGDLHHQFISENTEFSSIPNGVPRGTSAYLSRSESVGAFESVFDEDESRLLGMDDESGGEGFDEFGLNDDSSDVGTILSPTNDRRHPLMIRNNISNVFKSQITRPLQTINLDDMNHYSRRSTFVSRWAPNKKKTLSQNHLSKSYSSILKKIRRIPESRIKTYSISQVRRIYSHWLLWNLKTIKKKSHEDFDDSDSSIAWIDNIWETFGCTIEAFEVASRSTGISKLDYESNRMDMEDSSLENENTLAYPYIGIIDKLKTDQKMLLRTLSSNIITYTALSTQSADIEMQFRNRCLNFSRIFFHGVLPDDTCCRLNSNCPNASNNLPSGKEYNSIDESYTCVPNLTPLLSMESVPVSIEFIYGIAPMLNLNSEDDAFKISSMLFMMQVVKSIIFIVDNVCYSSNIAKGKFEDSGILSDNINNLEAIWAKQRKIVEESILSLKESGIVSETLNNNETPSFDPKISLLIRSFISSILKSLGITNEEFIFQLLNNSKCILSNMELIYSLVEVMVLPFMRSLSMILYAKYGIIPFNTNIGEDWLSNGDNRSILETLKLKEDSSFSNNLSEQLYGNCSTELERLLMSLKLPSLLDFMTLNCFKSDEQNIKDNLYLSKSFALNLMQGWCFHLGGIFKIYLQQWQIPSTVIGDIVLSIKNEPSDILSKLDLSIYDYFYLFRKCFAGYPGPNSTPSIAILSQDKLHIKGKEKIANPNSLYSLLNSECLSRNDILSDPPSPIGPNTALWHQHCACQQSIFSAPIGLSSIYDSARSEISEPFTHYGKDDNLSTVSPVGGLSRKLTGNKDNNNDSDDEDVGPSSPQRGRRIITREVVEDATAAPATTNEQLPENVRISIDRIRSVLTEMLGDQAATVLDNMPLETEALEILRRIEGQQIDDDISDVFSDEENINGVGTLLEMLGGGTNEETVDDIVAEVLEQQEEEDRDRDSLLLPQLRGSDMVSGSGSQRNARPPRRVSTSSKRNKRTASELNSKRSKNKRKETKNDSILSGGRIKGRDSNSQQDGLKVSHVFRSMFGESYYVTLICKPNERLVPIERSKSIARLSLAGTTSLYGSSTNMLGLHYGSYSSLGDYAGSPITSANLYGRQPSPRPLGDIRDRQRNTRSAKRNNVIKNEEERNFTIGELSDTPSDYDMDDIEFAGDIDVSDNENNIESKSKNQPTYAIGIDGAASDTSANEDGWEDESESSSDESILNFVKNSKKKPNTTIVGTSWKYEDEFFMNIPIRNPVLFELVALPRKLDILLGNIEKWHCNNCEKVPVDPAICLICGTLVCSQSRCCSSFSTNKGECNIHADLCGGGTGMFFLIKKCVLLVLFDGRGHFLNSPYLDLHGEVDPGLRRGKPQFLNGQRYDEIKVMWVKHQIPSYIARKVDQGPLTAGWGTL